ncbi:ABC transporter ATP-binding protein [Paenibacillus cymbidii]|uniref:ABC transporter ATP-binding protein n=1 Tax=Paenibacillus cymbidii TaxID=1639034 RepID=UPI001F263036|nr:ABC transporter ATP-binding protein [Paenibacillus cymbidii]
MIIETKQLTKTFANGFGCRDVSLSVSGGRIFGLLGPNGAGKSTFVKMIVGLLHPDSGSGTLLGHPLGTPESRRRVGYLPELFRFQDWLSANETLVYHACLGGMTLAQAKSAAMRDRIRDVLRLTGLEGRGADRLRHYSKGMQQRFGIACALLLDPELIILDEPSSALDPIGRYDIRQLIVRLREQGKTIFLNTHLLEDVEAVCDDVAFLHEGRLRAAGPIGELLHAGNKWEVAVGGWLPELEAVVSGQLLPGMSFRVTADARDGSATLELTARHREQLGWFHRLLHEAEATVYETVPCSIRLEMWFLDMSTDGKGGSKS